jgi:hypothetical protein
VLGGAERNGITSKKGAFDVKHKKIRRPRQSFPTGGALMPHYKLSDFGQMPKPASVDLGDVPFGKNRVNKLSESLRDRLATPGGDDRSRVDSGVFKAMLEEGLTPEDALATFIASARGEDARERKTWHFPDYVQRTLREAVSKVKPKEAGSGDDEGFFEEVNSSHDEPEEKEAPLRIVRGADVKTITPSFFVRPYLPDGSLSILFGDPGTSKTSLVIWMLARITRGKDIFGCATTPADVMLLSNEDSPGINKARFLAAGGDDKRIFFEDFECETFALEHIGRVRATIEEHRPKVVVIDSVMSHVGGKADVYRQNEVSAILTPLQTTAAHFNVVMIGLMHMNKQDAAKVIYRVGGSIGFVGASRSALFLEYKPDEPNARILCHAKSNYSARGQSQEMEILNHKDGVVRLEWVGPSELNANDLLTKPDKESGGKKLREAEDLINDLLLDGGMKSTEIYARADELGIAVKTLERAKKKLGVQSIRSDDNKHSVWVKREKSVKK